MYRKSIPYMQSSTITYQNSTNQSPQCALFHHPKGVQKCESCGIVKTCTTDCLKQNNSFHEASRLGCTPKSVTISESFFSLTWSLCLHAQPLFCFFTKQLTNERAKYNISISLMVHLGLVVKSQLFLCVLITIPTGNP